ncbi:MAG: hypothetical protein LBT08_05215 [Synergistaceae bacterium]|nr:hypothetical protein [Synergistaceae bacterium]
MDVRFSIGIITAERSMEMIRSIHDEISMSCDVTYLPYVTMRSLSSVYEQNIHRFDGVIFSGAFPYSYIVNHIGAVFKPHAYFELTDRDYYRTFARLLHQFPGIDISRVLMDRPTIDMDFSPIFGDARPMFFDFFVSDTPSLERAYDIAMEQSLRLWRNGEIDRVITRLTNLEAPLRSAGVPYELLFPSEASMIEIFHLLCGRIQSRMLVDSMTASGIAAAADPSPDGISEKMAQSLAKFNERNGMSLVIRGDEKKFELTTTNEILKDITQGYSNCLLSAYVKEDLCVPVCVG